MDDQALISVRSRKNQLRKLDAKKITQQKSAIQLANTALPLLFILLAGIGQFMIRKKKWS
jgi:hypothetical protein